LRNSGNIYDWLFVIGILYKKFLFTVAYDIMVKINFEEDLK